MNKKEEKRILSQLLVREEYPKYLIQCRKETKIRGLNKVIGCSHYANDRCECPCHKETVGRGS